MPQDVGNDATDSDVGPTGRSATVVLTSTQTMVIDAGMGIPPTPTPTSTPTPTATPTATPTQPGSPLPTPIDRGLLDNHLYIPHVVHIPTWLEIAASETLRTTYDRDEDGISDWFELIWTGTDPWQADTDGNSTQDYTEDPDGDNLPNYLEITLGTDPLLADTDGDSLSDSIEQLASTNPLLPDSDSDGLDDDSELRLGTDPNDADSNNNGIADGQETFTTLIADSNNGASFLLTGIGDVAKGATIRNLLDDTRFQQLAGQVGSAIRLTTELSASAIQVKLPYVLAEVPNGDVAHLEILYYNEEAVRFEFRGRVGNDATHAWADSTDTGIYLLIHMPTWQAQWAAAAQTLQSASVTDFDDDTDSDGLPDILESFGFPKSDGTVITTNPNLWDSDGDGLSDAEEIGILVTSDSGSHYTVTTDPNLQDTDGDGLLDPEELDIGTNPYLADTDGDTLSDLFELNIDFDPTHPDPDEDGRRDDVEYANDTDPFYYNPTTLGAIRIAAVGAVLGEAGENFVENGWLSEDTFFSVYYMAGWMASGFIAVGDIRDLAADATQLDVGGVALGIVALVPLLGDSTRVATIIGKMRTFALTRLKGYKLMLPLIRWTMRTFESKPILTNIGLFDQFIKAIGYAQETIDALAPDIIKRLAKRANRPAIINRMIQQGGEIKQFKLSPTLYDAIKAKANDTTLWKAGTSIGEREGTEAAVHILETEGYEILYVQRTNPLFTDTNGVEHYLHNGPDIVARKNGKTVIVEVKGTTAAGETNFTNARFEAPLNGIPMYRPSRTWLDTNPERYLDSLAAASSAMPGNNLLSDAVQRLEDVAYNFGDYEAIMIGYSTNNANYGKLDDVWDRLTQDALNVRTYLINP